MNTERFIVSEMLIDAAMNLEFMFTTKEAMNYLRPKLSGSIKKRESLIKSAIKRGLEDDLYLQDGDSYRLALPPVSMMEEVNEVLKNKCWSLAHLTETENKMETKGKINGKKRNVLPKKISSKTKGKIGKKSKYLKTKKMFGAKVRKNYNNGDNVRQRNKNTSNNPYKQYSALSLTLNNCQDEGSGMILSLCSYQDNCQNETLSEYGCDLSRRSSKNNETISSITSDYLEDNENKEQNCDEPNNREEFISNEKPSVTQEPNKKKLWPFRSYN